MTYPVNNKLFDKYTVEANQGHIPDILKGWKNLGCLAITRDTKHRGYYHIIFYIFQSIHAWITGRKNVDPNINHAMILVNRNNIEDHSRDFITAHAVKDSDKGSGDIKTIRTTYLDDYDVTQMIIYVPKEEKLRALLCKNAQQTSCLSRSLKLADDENKKLMKFSFFDIIGTFFRNKRKQTQIQKVSEAAKERLAYLVADLLKGTQIFEKDGVNPRSFICSAYAMSILQGSMIINALTPTDLEELQNIKDRHVLAHKILDYMNDETSEHSLSKCYRNNKVCRLDARFLMSSYAAKRLDKLSESIFI